MADINKNITPQGSVPDSDLLLTYLKREMSNAEKHELEKRMLADDFLADAAEGLTAVNNPLVIADLTAQINAKYKAPSNTPKEPKRSPLALVGNTLAVAASIALLIVAGYFISQNVGTDNKAIQVADKGIKQEAPANGTVDERGNAKNALAEDINMADSAGTADKDAELAKPSYTERVRTFRYNRAENAEGVTNASDDFAPPAPVEEMPATADYKYTPTGNTGGAISQTTTNGSSIDFNIYDKYGPASNNVSYTRTPILEKGKVRNKNNDVKADTVSDIWGNRTAVVDENNPGYYVDGVLIRTERDDDNSKDVVTPAKKLNESTSTTATKAKSEEFPTYAAKESQKALNKGLDKYNKGDYKSAINDLEDALKKDPTNQKAIYSLGMAYKNTNRPDNAIAQFNKLPTTSPYYENGLWEKANIYLNKNNDAACIATLKTIVKLNGAYKIRAQNMINNLEEQMPKKGK